jgi:hypothetical protein
MPLAERQIPPTFATQLAQTLRSLPQPCLIKQTGGSSQPAVEQTISWVLRYGNIPEGQICSIYANELPSADQQSIKATSEPGIVIHWNPAGVPGDKLANFLSAMGLNVRVSHRLDKHVPENLIWIDVGNGSPWK